jgi:hypothetical protein
MQHIGTPLNGDSRMNSSQNGNTIISTNNILFHRVKLLLKGDKELIPIDYEI